MSYVPPAVLVVAYPSYGSLPITGQVDSAGLEGVGVNPVKVGQVWVVESENRFDVAPDFLGRRRLPEREVEVRPLRS
jgi:hypothetical protein